MDLEYQIKYLEDKIREAKTPNERTNYERMLKTLRSRRDIRKAQIQDIRQPQRKAKVKTNRFEQFLGLPDPALESMILGMDNYWDIINLCTSSKRLVQLCSNNPDIQRHINESIFAPKAFGGTEPDFNYLVFDSRPGIMVTDVLESIVRTLLSGVLNEQQGRMVENSLRIIKERYSLLWNKLIDSLRNPDIMATLVPWGQPVQNFDQLVEKIRYLDDQLINQEIRINQAMEAGRFQPEPKPTFSDEEPEWIMDPDRNVVNYMVAL